MDLTVSSSNPIITFQNYVKEISENNPLMVLATVGILALYLVVFRYAGKGAASTVGKTVKNAASSYSPTKNKTIYILDIFLWGVLI